MPQRIFGINIYLIVGVVVLAVVAKVGSRWLSGSEAHAASARPIGAKERGNISITDKNAIVVDESAVDSDDPDYDVVQANIAFLNALRAQYLRFDEMSREALRSYQVDYYLAQMDNGGFAQFVRNSYEQRDTLTIVREGLTAIGAKRHLALFDEGVGIITSLGETRLQKFLSTPLEDYASSPERAALEAIDDRFYALEKKEDLRLLNRAWLRAHPALAPASVARIKAELQRRGAQLPDRAARIAAAEAAAPRYMKLIRALAAKAGMTLEGVTAGDPTREYVGTKTTAWYFLTNEGLFHMIDMNGKAIMFRGKSTTDRVCEIDAP